MLLRLTENEKSWLYRVKHALSIVLASGFELVKKLVRIDQPYNKWRTRNDPLVPGRRTGGTVKFAGFFDPHLRDSI